MRPNPRHRGRPYGAWIAVALGAIAAALGAMDWARIPRNVGDSGLGSLGAGIVTTVALGLWLVAALLIGGGLYALVRVRRNRRDL